VKVLLNFHLGADVRIAVPPATLSALVARFPDVSFVAADSREALAREAPTTDVFYGFEFPPDLVRIAPRLRWIQSISAGIERNLSAPIVERGILVTNGSGIAAGPIAEHTIALMLALCRNLHVAVRVQQAARWDRQAVMGGAGTPLRELAGSRVAVLGLGPIGMTVAHHAAALGALVRGMRRHPPQKPESPFEMVVGPRELDGLVAWADFVVLAVPHTSETDHMIGAAQLRDMRAEAFLVNVARGSVVDEPALVDALRRGAIAGAALDVFAEEPLPESSPLWSLPNVILTPHVAGATPHYFHRALELFADNLERYRRGERLRNLVDPALGYPRN
jgi:phosphoglycerate dehydrogenase-like enzyme